MTTEPIPTAAALASELAAARREVAELRHLLARVACELVHESGGDFVCATYFRDGRKCDCNRNSELARDIDAALAKPERQGGAS